MGTQCPRGLRSSGGVGGVLRHAPLSDDEQRHRGASLCGGRRRRATRRRGDRPGVQLRGNGHGGPPPGRRSGLLRHRPGDTQPRPPRSRRADHTTHPGGHAGTCPRTARGHGADPRGCRPARPRGHRGRRPGPWRHLPRRAGGLTGRLRGLQPQWVQGPQRRRGRVVRDGRRRRAHRGQAPGDLRRGHTSASARAVPRVLVAPRRGMELPEPTSPPRRSPGRSCGGSTATTARRRRTLAA